MLGIVLNPAEKTVCLLRLSHAVMHPHHFQSAQNLSRIGSRSPAKACLNTHKDKWWSYGGSSRELYEAFPQELFSAPEEIVISHTACKLQRQWTKVLKIPQATVTRSKHNYFSTAEGKWLSHLSKGKWMTRSLPQTLECAGYEIYRRQN